MTDELNTRGRSKTPTNASLQVGNTESTIDCNPELQHDDADLLNSWTLLGESDATQPVLVTTSVLIKNEQSRPDAVKHVFIQEPTINVDNENIR